MVSEESNISFSTNQPKDNIENFVLAQNDEITIKTNSAYHQQGLIQAKVGFYSSIFGGALGFIIILIAVFLKKDQAILVGSAGVIIDAISAIFFKISNDATNARTAYFDKLRDDTRRRDSLMLCNAIEDKKIKDNLKVKLSLYLAGIDEDKICDKMVDICVTKHE